MTRRPRFSLAEPCVAMKGAACVATLLVGVLSTACGDTTSRNGSADAGDVDGTLGDATFDATGGDAGSIEVSVQVTAHAVDRCGVWQPDHQPGLSFETPTNIHLGVTSVELMQGHMDSNPVSLPLPSHVVVVDASSGENILDASGLQIPSGTYTHIRIGLAFARYEVKASAHVNGAAVGGILEMDMTLSDHEDGEGRMRSQGQYTATFSAFGQTSSFSGTTPMNCTLSAWGGIAATSGGQFVVRVPIPGGPVVVDSNHAEQVRIALDFPMEDTFAWRDLDEDGFAPGVLDLVQPPAVAEMPDTMVECHLLMADRCLGEAVVPIQPTWPMPDSSIGFCSDGAQIAACPDPGQSGYGQDAQYAVNPPDYEVDGDTVLDRVTGLEWQRGVATEAYDWWDARDYCSNLSLGGADDWRLPSRIELVSILDFGGLDPTIDHDAFPDTPSDFFWSSSPVPFLNLAYGVRFELGFIYDHDPTGTGHVRCVRGSYEHPDPRFDWTDEVVTDHGSGLEWQRGHTDARLWVDALAACEELDLGGHQDWRLPTLKELQTLVDGRRLQPSIDVVAFPDTPSEWFWSSTPIQFPPNEGWATSFTDGYASIHAFSEFHLARCVRDP
ncbi:MAG: DUF1566 domain-containing protein [Deltaproteobacteria bacterium]|nr:DUF1566 domain-containing protein [Deltaproteobacteria bacterium]